jgi:nitronate monooxygenase
MGPPVSASAGNVVPPDFDAQCEAFLQVGPKAVSSIMGVFPRDFIGALKDRAIAWCDRHDASGGKDCS